MGLSSSKFTRFFRAQQTTRNPVSEKMKKSSDQQGLPVLPSKRKAKARKEPLPKSRKRARSLSSCTSPSLSLHDPKFSWYEDDLWIEIAKRLDGRELISLAVTSRWFYRLIMEDSIWKYACLRDLQVLSSHHTSFKWHQLYASAFDGSHSYSFRQREKHIDWMRIGAFLVESPKALLTEKLALPSNLTDLAEDQKTAIELSGICILTDVRTGIWIADLQLVRCPVCNLNTCEGTMQILDVRHIDLFLEEGFRKGSWQFEDIGSHRIQKPANAAAGGVFDYKHVHSPCTAGLLNTSCWFAEAGDWQPRARLSANAVAVNTNLQPNEGLHVRFQAMRSRGSDGKVVSIRISQQLI